MGALWKWRVPEIRLQAVCGALLTSALIFSPCVMQQCTAGLTFDNHFADTNVSGHLSEICVLLLFLLQGPKAQSLIRIGCDLLDHPIYSTWQRGLFETSRSVTRPWRGFLALDLNGNGRMGLLVAEWGLSHLRHCREQMRLTTGVAMGHQPLKLDL